VKTIRFTAPIALLDTWTHDGRMLRAPADGTVRHHAFPLPVRGGYDELASYGGTIDALEIRDGILTASGTLTDPDIADALAQGAVWMELDVDDIPDSALIHYGNTGNGSPGLEFTSWRVTAVTLGTSPCWNLGSAQIERTEG
jgi:hypothetical protein